MRINKLRIILLILSAGAAAFFYFNLWSENSTQISPFEEAGIWYMGKQIWQIIVLPLFIYLLMFLIPINGININKKGESNENK